MKEKERVSILISACLLGENCKYSGGSNRNEGLLQWRKRLEMDNKAEFIPICPEVMGGLSTPRLPAEIQGESVVAEDGRDVTAEYQKGAFTALELAKVHGCRLAILKERSPSCGSGKIYDGTFSKHLIKGDGITAGLLQKNGITVVGETQASKVLEKLL